MLYSRPLMYSRGLAHLKCFHDRTMRLCSQLLAKAYFPFLSLMDLSICSLIYLNYSIHFCYLWN